MKIGMILYNDFENDNRVHREARDLAAHGHDVLIVATRSHPGLAESERRGYAVRRVPVSLGWRTRLRGGFNRIARERPASLTGRLIDRARKVRVRQWWVMERNRRRFGQGVARVLDNWRPDAVHCHDLNVLDIGARVAARLDVPFIYDSHELWRENNYLLKAPSTVLRRYRRMEAELIGRAACVIMTAESQAEKIREWYPGINPIIVMNCQDGEPTPRTDYLRRRLGLGDEKRILLYQGLVHRDRGVFVTLEALSRLPARFVGVILGFGEDVPSVVRWIRERRMESRAFYLPPVPVEALPPVTASADYGIALFQNTSLAYYLISPNKVFEYMRAGLPLVTSNFPEFVRLWDSADLGERVDPANPMQVADAVLRLEADAARRERITRNAQQLVRDTYNWQNQMKNLLAVYDSLAAAS